jgi:hypothetical protein
VNGAIYLALCVNDTFHRHFFSCFHQEYLRFNKQDYWRLVFLDAFLDPGVIFKKIELGMMD